MFSWSQILPLQEQITFHPRWGEIFRMHLAINPCETPVVKSLDAEGSIPIKARRKSSAPFPVFEIPSASERTKQWSDLCENVGLVPEKVEIHDSTFTYNDIASFKGQNSPPAPSHNHDFVFRGTQVAMPLSGVHSWRSKSTVYGGLLRTHAQLLHLSTRPLAESQSGLSISNCGCSKTWKLVSIALTKFNQVRVHEINFWQNTTKPTVNDDLIEKWVAH